jgi:hypothetical protein
VTCEFWRLGLNTDRGDDEVLIKSLNGCGRVAV